MYGCEWVAGSSESRRLAGALGRTGMSPRGHSGVRRRHRLLKKTQAWRDADATRRMY